MLLSAIFDLKHTMIFGASLKSIRDNYINTGGKAQALLPVTTFEEHFKEQINLKVSIMIDFHSTLHILF